MNGASNQLDRPWMFSLVRALMLAAMVIYALLALKDAETVDWGAPWIHNDKVGTWWFVFATAAAILTWTYGWALPWLSRRKPGWQTTLSGRRWEYSAFGRFMVRACTLHGGGIWGLVLSFRAHDARYALVSLVMSSVMVLLLPRPKSPTQPAAGDTGEPPPAVVP